MQSEEPDDDDELACLIIPGTTGVISAQKHTYRGQPGLVKMGAMVVNVHLPAHQPFSSFCVSSSLSQLAVMQREHPSSDCWLWTYLTDLRTAAGY